MFKIVRSLVRGANTNLKGAQRHALAPVPAADEADREPRGGQCHSNEGNVDPEVSCEIDAGAVNLLDEHGAIESHLPLTTTQEDHVNGSKEEDADLHQGHILGRLMMVQAAPSWHEAELR